MKTICGSFFEIEHPNRAERRHIHDTMCRFSADDWKASVRDLHVRGIDTLVLLSTALRGYAYFPFDGFPYPPHLACPDVLDVVLSEADKTGQQVFLGVGFYGDSDSVNNSTDPAIVATALSAMDRLFALYGHHPSVVGWYIADEWCIWEHFDERFIQYINVITAHARSLCREHRVMLAPFGTHCLKADDIFVSQLERIEADIIAYQDEIGVKKMSLEELPRRFEALYKAHEKAGRAKLWADVETFSFEGEVYKSPLLAAPPERITAQLEAVSPYVDSIVAYTAQRIITNS